MKLNISSTLLTLSLLFTYTLSSPIPQPTEATELDLANADAYYKALAAAHVNSLPKNNTTVNIREVTDSYLEAEVVPKSTIPSTSKVIYEPALKPDEPAGSQIEKRQISPWPHFRECKVNDPRPECPHHRRSSDETVEARSSDSTGSRVIYNEPEVIERRQISPWPHFRECRKNDARPYCPHPPRSENEAIEKRDTVTTGTESYWESPEGAKRKERRQISPWPHFRECVENDPRPDCPHPAKNRFQQHPPRQISAWPHFRECTKNDPRSECPHSGSGMKDVPRGMMWGLVSSLVAVGVLVYGF